MAKNFLGLAKTFLERSLLIWLLLLCTVAFQWPHWFGSAWDPFIASKPYNGYFFCITMFCIGGLIPPREIEQVFRRWPTVFGGTTLQYLSMPLIAYIMVKSFGLTEGWAIGVMMAGCVPGAMASNVLTLMSRGNVSYSVCLTTSATLLSPFIVPWALKLTLQTVVHNFPVYQTIYELCWMVVLPVILGHLLTRFSVRFRSIIQLIGPIVANLTILWIIAAIVGLKRESFLDVPTTIFWALLILNLGGYCAGFFGGWAMRIDGPMRRALTLEIGMQNAGLGALLATKLFPDSHAAVPAVIYMFGCMLTGTILARVWAEVFSRNGNRESDTSDTVARLSES